MRECINCEHMKFIIDSEDEIIYICGNRESGAYLEETGICGNCDLDDENYDERSVENEND